MNTVLDYICIVKDSHATVVTKYFAKITTLFLQCNHVFIHSLAQLTVVHPHFHGMDLRMEHL